MTNAVSKTAPPEDAFAAYIAKKQVADIEAKRKALTLQLSQLPIAQVVADTTAPLNPSGHALVNNNNNNEVIGGKIRHSHFNVKIDDQVDAAFEEFIKQKSRQVVTKGQRYVAVSSEAGMDAGVDAKAAALDTKLQQPATTANGAANATTAPLGLTKGIHDKLIVVATYSQIKDNDSSPEVWVTATKQLPERATPSGKEHIAASLEPGPFQAFPTQQVATQQVSTTAEDVNGASPAVDVKAQVKALQDKKGASKFALSPHATPWSQGNVGTQGYSGRMVVFFIRGNQLFDPKPTKYIVHRDIICQYSPILSKHLHDEKGNEEKESAIKYELECIGAATFEHFLQWAYIQGPLLPISGTELTGVTSAEKGQKCAKDFRTLTDLWELAEKWEVVPLKNAVLSRLDELCLQYGGLPEDSTGNWTENLSGTLRVFLLDRLSYYNTKYPGGDKVQVGMQHFDPAKVLQQQILRSNAEIQTLQAELKTAEESNRNLQSNLVNILIHRVSSNDKKIKGLQANLKVAKGAHFLQSEVENGLDDPLLYEEPEAATELTPVTKYYALVSEI